MSLAVWIEEAAKLRAEVALEKERRRAVERELTAMAEDLRVAGHELQRLRDKVAEHAGIA